MLLNDNSPEDLLIYKETDEKKFENRNTGVQRDDAEKMATQNGQLKYVQYVIQKNLISFQDLATSASNFNLHLIFNRKFSTITLQIFQQMSHIPIFVSDEGKLPTNYSVVCIGRLQPAVMNFELFSASHVFP